MLALKTEQELLSHLGQKIKRMRLGCNWTRHELAARSDIPYSTLRRLETTGEASMRDYLKALRALGGLDELADLMKPPPVSPYELLQLRGKQRERASRLVAQAVSTATATDPAPQADIAAARPTANSSKSQRRVGTYWD